MSGEEHRDGDGGGPLAVLVPFGGLRHVEGLQDLPAHLEVFLPFIPRHVRVELHAERGGEHRRRQVFGVVPRLLLRLAERMVLGEITVLRIVRGHGHADGGGDEAVRFVRRVPCHHAERHLSRLQQFESLGRRDALAAGGIDAGHGDQIALFDAGVAEGEFE